MGVKGLWEMVSPTGELICMASLAGQAVAVDLASWLVDTQSLQLGHIMTRPHLRNLFFRTAACLEAGVLPVMVLEGEAPSLKWNTIDARNNARNLGRPGGGGGGGATATKRKRSYFNGVLKKCGELFDLLGVPWVCAKGEAEATCAALNYHKVVEGVVTQDSDVFLYGGNTVFRNFTASQRKATAEKYRMDIIEERLQLTRGGMILLAILLGCDYLPGGVHGVGRDTALRFLKDIYAAGDRDPTQRLKQWVKEDIPTLSSTELASTKWKKGNTDMVEDGLKKRLVATDGFPFTQLLAEFRHRLPQPLKEVLWTRPDFEGLVHWCVRMLDWEVPYALEKVAPVVTRWTVTQGAIPRPLQPVRAVKRCVRRGVVSLMVEWQVSGCSSLLLDTPQQVTTEEPLHLLRTSLPYLVQEFEGMTLNAKKGKSKSNTRKAKVTIQDKENIWQNNHTITKYFKTVKPRSTVAANNSAARQATRIPGSKVKDARQLEEEEKGQVTKSTHDFKPTKEHSRKDLQQHKQFRSGIEEDEDAGAYSESDERELSFIIDRIINMDMNGWKKQSCIPSKNMQGNDVNECESKEGFLAIQDLDGKSSEVSKADEKTENNGSLENIHLPQPPSLYERASKRLSQKNKQQLEFLQNTVTKTEPGLCSSGNSLNEGTENKSVSSKNHLCNIVIEPRIGTDVENDPEGRFYEIQEKTLQSPIGVDLEREVQSHNVSRDMFEDSLGEDTLARIFEDTLALDSSLPDLSTAQSVTSNKVTGHNPDLTPKCTSPQDCNLHISPLHPDSHFHESDASHATSFVHHSLGLKPSIHYLETDNSEGTSLEEHTGVKLSDTSIGYGNIHKKKQSNILSPPNRSVCIESMKTKKQNSAPFSPSATSPVCKVSLERELGDRSVKLPSRSVDFENTHIHKQDSAPPPPFSTTPIFKASAGKELKDRYTELSSRFVHLEKSHTEKQGNASPSVSACKAAGVSQKGFGSTGNTASPLHTGESWYSTNRYSSHIKTQETTPFRDVDGCYDGVLCESYIQGSVHEQLTGGSGYNRDAANEKINVVGKHKCSPQQSAEINLYQSYQTCYLTQFCPNEGKKGNGGEMGNPSVSSNSKSPSGPPSGPDGKAWPFDPFSPAEVTLTLAQRLRLKYSDKQFKKLLDDLE